MDALRRRKAPPRASDAQPLSAVLESLQEDRSLSAGMALGHLGRRWREVVGDRLAAECAPSALRGGVLVVRVSSAAWAAQVGFLAGEVVRRANEVLGEDAVAEVRVTVGGGPGEGAARAAGSPTGPGGPPPGWRADGNSNGRIAGR